MNKRDTAVFGNLYRDAFAKCFGYPLKAPLSETDSKFFSIEILKRTGLVVGWKSLKNYSFHILGEPREKEENPSIATLDTLGRYVLAAPPTDEIQRQANESHYPYWYEYRNKLSQPSKKGLWRKPLPAFALSLSVLLLSIGLIIILHTFKNEKLERFSDTFDSVEEDSLIHRGWFVQSKDTIYWNRRSEKVGHLALFTLRGDNWPDSANVPNIKNILLRNVHGDCFTVEVHLSSFVPQQNWQQAGILLLEDTSFVGKSLRLSIGYNDFSGGFPPVKEILIQAITSLGNGFGKPEEIAHKRIFSVEQGEERLISQNLRSSALQIEKQGKRFRLLFSNGSMENSAFKEVATKDFDMKVQYVAIFALKGFVNDTNCTPAYFKFFNLIYTPCD